MRPWHIVAGFFTGMLVAALTGSNVLGWTIAVLSCLMYVDLDGRLR